MKRFILCFLLLSTSILFSQTKLGGRTGGNGGETNTDNKKSKDSVAPIDFYKIISVNNDTTFVDTTLTILKDYKFNYLRKDNFELLPFSNTGQTYNSLSLTKDYKETFPDFGARARHFNFMDVEDVSYYYVPTPLTEIYFKTVPEQGQQLDAFFTLNTSENLNASIAYKGTRALGKFQHILTSTGNLRMTLNYHSDDKKYNAKAHFVSQDLLNEENGGLTDQAMQQYIDKEEEFNDRSVLEVNYENAESILYGKRFYLNHQYEITRPADSINELSIGHIFDYSYKKFVFKQDNARNDLYGESFESTGLRDLTRLKTLFNEISVNYSNSLAGSISFKAGMEHYEYGYNSVYITDDNIIGDRLNGNILHVGGSYKKQIGGFALNADARLNLSEEIPGNFLAASASYNFDKENKIEFGVNQNSNRPNFNFLLYQSDYINYNWQNDFSNETSQRIFGNFKSEKIVDIFGSLSQIQNYSFFALNEEASVKPFQYDDPVRYIKVKAEREFDFGLFGSYNTIMYQEVLEGSSVLNLPELVTRNSVYYKDFWFDKALYLQTGFTFKYFSKYQMNAYDPILAEFYVQDAQEFGGYPVVDYFFNAKIDQARIFFKLQHLNSLLNGNNNFSAPRYPYSDFLIRFGLVWNFFF